MPLPGLMPTSSSWLHFCGGPSSEPSIGYTGPLDTLHVTACALFYDEHAATTLPAPLKNPSAFPAYRIGKCHQVDPTLAQCAELCLITLRVTRWWRRWKG